MSSDVRALVKAEATTSRRLDALAPKMEELTKAVGELVEANKAFVRETAAAGLTTSHPPEPRRVPLWARLIIQILAALASLAGVASLLVALIMIAPALQSLEATQAALQRDEISQTFNAVVSRCVHVELDPPGVTGRGTILQTVITNTGRLPITILDVKGDNAYEVASVEYSWIPLESHEVVSHGGPIYLEVGKAVAIQAFIPGNGFNPTLHFSLSSGKSDQTANFVPYDNDIPELIATTYERFPQVCG